MIVVEKFFHLIHTPPADSPDFSFFLKLFKRFTAVFNKILNFPVSNILAVADNPCRFNFNFILKAVASVVILNSCPKRPVAEN